MVWVDEIEETGGGQGIERRQVWVEDSTRPATPVVTDDEATVSVGGESNYESMYEMLISDLQEYVDTLRPNLMEMRMLFSYLAAKGHTGLELSPDPRGRPIFLRFVAGSEDSSSEEN